MAYFVEAVFSCGIPRKTIACVYQLLDRCLSSRPIHLRDGMPRRRRFQKLNRIWKEGTTVKAKSLFGIEWLSLVLAAALAAEPTGNLHGVMEFEDGSAAPGVEIVARPVDGGPLLATTTDTRGLFRLVALPPGEYDISYGLAGHPMVLQKGVRVTSGNTSIRGVIPETSIHDRNAVMIAVRETDRETTTTVKTVDREQIEKLPAGRSLLDLVMLKPGSLTQDGCTRIGQQEIGTIPSRNRYFTDYLNLAPGMTPELKMHGSTAMDNRYNLDGLDITDPISGSNAIGLNMDAIEEIQVQSGGLPAEYGSARGAVINVITKSGTNKMSGTASVYMKHHSLRSDNTDNPYYKNAQTGYRYEFEPTIALGGPIIKDKLWFFGSGNLRYAQTYAPGFPYDKNEPINPASAKLFPYLKFTYAPNTDHLFNFSYNYSDIRYNYHDAYSNYTESVSRRYSEPAHVLHADWLYRMCDRFYTEFDVGYTRHTAGLYARQEGPTFVDLKTYRYSGGYYINKDETRKNRLSIRADGTVFVDNLMGSHELKFGAEFLKSNVESEFVPQGNPPYDFSKIYGYPNTTGGFDSYYGENFNGGYEQSIHFRRISAYIQDSITWGKLTASLGVRYDKEQTAFPAQNENEQPLKNPFGNPIDRRVPKETTPFEWSSISPRLGLTYALGAERKTLLSASYARYAGQPGKSVWLEGAHPVQPFAYGARLNPSTRESVPGTEYPIDTPYPVSVGYPGYDLQVPVLNEFTFGVERDVWKDWSLGVRYIKKWDRNLIETVDASRLNIDQLLKNGTYEWIDYQAVTATDPYSKKPVTFYNDLNPGRTPMEYLVNPPGAERNYNGVELTFNKRLANRWMLRGNFTWANWEGTSSSSFDYQGKGTSCLYNDPNSHINNEGHLENERRYQFKAYGQYQTPWWGINLGAFFQYNAGQRWTRQVSSDYLKVDLNQGSETINAEERGKYSYPSQFLLDLRIEKQFKTAKFAPTVYADIFNFFNSGTATKWNTDSSIPYIDLKEELGWVDPRIFRLGAKIEF